MQMLPVCPLSIVVSIPPGTLYLYQIRADTHACFIDETASNSAYTDVMFLIAGQVELCWVPTFSNSAIGVLCHAAYGL